MPFTRETILRGLEIFELDILHLSHPVAMMSAMRIVESKHATVVTGKHRLIDPGQIVTRHHHAAMLTIPQTS